MQNCDGVSRRGRNDKDYNIYIEQGACDEEGQGDGQGPDPDHENQSRDGRRQRFSDGVTREIEIDGPCATPMPGMAHSLLISVPFTDHIGQSSGVRSIYCRQAASDEESQGNGREPTQLTSHYGSFTSNYGSFTSH